MDDQLNIMLAVNVWDVFWEGILLDHSNLHILFDKFTHNSLQIANRCFVVPMGI